MVRSSIMEAKSLIGHEVVVKGHVCSIRDLGKIGFLNLRDASGQIQCVVEDKEGLVRLRSLTPEATVAVSGEISSAPSNHGDCELKTRSIERLTGASETPPVELAKNKKVDRLALSTLLDYRPITLRNEKVRAIFKLQSEITRAFRDFLSKQAFVEINTPKIVATGTEGGAQLFSLDYFGKQAFLAQSPQFYKQIMVGVFERVFETAAVYRAEEHDTTRHLNEYISLDFEMGFIESEQDVIAMETQLLRHIFAHIKENSQTELELFDASVSEITTIPQVTLEEACRILETHYKWCPGESSNHDLDPEGERLLSEHFAREEGSELVFVLHYPLKARPFYTMALGSTDQDNPLSRSFDLLYRGLEITTGGQRIHEHDQLVAAIRGRGLEPEDFSEYLSCFKYGMPPHGGLAIGLERLTKQLLGLKSVKQASLFPRDLNRLKP